jgi:hypothetical protein
VNIRTFQPGDERTQAVLYNVAAFAMPGFRPATEDDVRKRTRARGFDPDTRFYAEEGGQVVGYCTLDPAQQRVSAPWCKPGFEAAGPPLFEAVLVAARERGLAKVLAAYRRDWEPVIEFLAGNGFVQVREVINYLTDPVDLPTVATRAGPSVRRLRPADLPAVAELGQGVIRLPADKLERHFFANPYIPAEAFLVLVGRDSETLAAVGLGLESSVYADVKAVDPLAPCWRLGAFGSEGLATKRVNGLFSFVAKPENAVPAGLGLLSEASQEMTEGTVTTIAAQCPSDAAHLVGFYARYFREQGRFPVFERTL